MRRSDGKKRAALFLAVLLCTACLGCMHVRSYISEGEPKLDRILGYTAPSGSEATDAKQGDWQQAYQSFIRSEAYLSFPGAAFGDNKGCIQFALHDFERDGVRYHHILNPATGYPAESDIAGVTLRAPKGRSADCDALATILLTMGEEKGLEAAEGYEGIEAFFITTDGRYVSTEGMGFEEE